MLVFAIPFLLCSAAIQGASHRENAVLKVSGPAYLIPLAEDFSKELKKESPTLNVEINTFNYL